MIDKHESRRLRAEIRRVLLEIWDPIGVGNEPNAHDEYDFYLGDIMDLVNQWRDRFRYCVTLAPHC
jgi:hypothetical protein